MPRAALPAFFLLAFDDERSKLGKETCSPAGRTSDASALRSGATLRRMRNTTWHIHVQRSVTLYGDSDSPVTLEPGEYLMREVDLVYYEIGERASPKGRLRLSQLLKLRGSGTLTIDGLFP